MKIATTKERILQFVDYKGISKSRFYEETGMKRGFLDGDKLQTSIPDTFIATIIAKYPEINLKWLLTGEGSMIREPSPPTQQPSQSPPVKPYSTQGPDGIPLVSMEAAAGFGTAEFAIKDEDIQNRYMVPDFNGIDFMIRVKGSSMYPKYSSGDIIACRILRESKFIQWNKCYVIATNEQGLLVKRLKKGSDDSSLLAVSDNKEYEPFEIPTAEITGIALVIGVIRME